MGRRRRNEEERVSQQSSHQERNPKSQTASKSQPVRKRELPGIAARGRGHGNHLPFCHTHHHVLSAEDDPKRQEHGIENALPNVSEEQHPRPVKADGKPLHRDVNERHGNSQSKDHPGEGETLPPSISSLQGENTEPQQPEVCLVGDKKTPHCSGRGSRLSPGPGGGTSCQQSPWH